MELCLCYVCVSVWASCSVRLPSVNASQVKVQLRGTEIRLIFFKGRTEVDLEKPQKQNIERKRVVFWLVRKRLEAYSMTT